MQTAARWRWLNVEFPLLLTRMPWEFQTDRTMSVRDAVVGNRKPAECLQQLRSSQVSMIPQRYPNPRWAGGLGETPAAGFHAASEQRNHLQATPVRDATGRRRDPKPVCRNSPAGARGVPFHPCGPSLPGTWAVRSSKAERMASCNFRKEPFTGTCATSTDPMEGAAGSVRSESRRSRPSPFLFWSSKPMRGAGIAVWMARPECRRTRHKAAAPASNRPE